MNLGFVLTALQKAGVSMSLSMTPCDITVDNVNVTVNDKPLSSQCQIMSIVNVNVKSNMSIMC